MVHGFGGGLLSERFLERRLAAQQADAHDAERLARGRLALRAWHDRSRQSLGPASGLRAMLEIGAIPLAACLGFEEVHAIVPLKSALAAVAAGDRSRVTLIVAGWGDRLDAFWADAVGEALRRATSWCLLFNGTHLRLVSAGRTYSRRHAEVDLGAATDDPAAFRALWLVMRADAFADPPRLEVLVAESDRQAAGVSRSLRAGVFDASRELTAALCDAPGRRGAAARPAAAFEQALTIVYRVLFLLFAEARGLVPVWNRVYRDSYSIDAMCDAAARSKDAAGSWDTLRAIGRLAHAGCRAGDLRVTPFNGRLFAPGRTPLAERNGLDDAAAMRAVLAVATQRAADGAARERISYRDLGVEQLGAIYETLLDYTPTVDRASSGRPCVRLVGGSGVRKETGTFYTPRPLAEYLVRRTLAPLTCDAPPDRILALRIVDPAVGSGAFLVAACRFLAGAYEAAMLRDGGCRPEDFDEVERARIRRLIAERCLYGVDLNPMAVQLARLSLWLATLAADRPLTFLDHRLRTGDSLLGAWVANLRQPPAPRRRPAQPATLPLFDERELQDLIGSVLPLRVRLESIPDDSVDQVHAKERMLAAMQAEGSTLSKWKRVADLWCSAWFAPAATLPPAVYPPLADAALTGHGALSPRSRERYLAAAAEIAGRRQFFHWELEFAEAFFDGDGRRRPDGGFDAVIGNPPWDMVRADAAPAGSPPPAGADARSGARLDASSVVRFTRDTGVYASQSDGHVNRYQMFLERAMDLARAGGRIGLVLPAGLAIDRGSARLRHRLLSTCRVDGLVGFDNRAGAFPIHRSVRFVAATATVGAASDEIPCRFGDADLAALETADAGAAAWFPLRLSPALLQRISGDDLTIPWLTRPLDLAIVERAASLFAPLGHAGGWHARFGRELNATGDRGAFVAPGRGLPIVEGRQIEPFRAHVAGARHGIEAAEAARRLRDRRFETARLAYRDVASPTNRLTLIAAVLPAGCVSTHTVFCLRTRLPMVAQHLLCGLFNSFVVNYLVRLRVSTHVTTAVAESLPIPRPDRSPRLCRRIAAIARGLARRADAMAAAALQAAVARLYALTREEFARVLETFPLVAAVEREAAMRAFVSEEEAAGR
ncbi:MAG: N-6 DNA methylase [Acidobacteria bacterium]|nr:N-6 DNA methylase [Acidobacteriota bacterium]